MANPFDFLNVDYTQPQPNAETGMSTLSSYATPNQLKTQRDLVATLLSHDKGGAQQDVHHWTQGLSNMANTLVGALLMKDAQRGENLEYERGAQAYDQSRAGMPGGGIDTTAPDQPLGSKLWGGIKGLFGSSPGSPGGAKAVAPAAGTAQPRQAPPQLQKAWSAIEQQYGLPAGYLAQTAGIESDFNPHSHNELSGADGYFQFIPSTARQYGLRYGTDTRDPIKSADAAARYAVANQQALRHVLGREPTAGELYLAHQQGTGGATALLTNPNAPAGTVIHPRNISANAGDPRAPASAFVQHWASRFPATTGGAPQTPAGAQPVAAALQQGQPPAQAANAPAAAAGPPGASKLDAQGNEIVDHSGGVPGTKVASLDPNAGITGAFDRSKAGADAYGANHLNVDPTKGVALIGDPGAGRVQVAGGPRPTGGTPITGGAVSGAGAASDQVLPPQYQQKRFPISPQQLHEAFRNPFVPWEMKQKMLEDYRTQFQPIQTQTIYGQPAIQPAGGGEPVIIREQQKQKIKAGDIETDLPFYNEPQPYGPPVQSLAPGFMNTPGGVPGISVPARPARPSGPAAPAAPGIKLGPEPGGPAPYGKPAVPAPAAPAAPAPQAPAPAPAAPTPAPSRREQLEQRLKELNGKKSEGEPTGKPAPVRTAALNTDTGTMSDAPPIGAEPKGPSAIPPPADEPKGPLATPPPAAEPGGTKVAQASGLPPIITDMYNWTQQQQINKELATDEGKADIKNFNDAAKIHQERAETSQTLKPKIQEQEAIVNDPDFPQGPGYQISNMLNAFKSYMGDEKGTAAYGKAQAFRKNVADSILTTMQTTLHGLGQVRNAEINLLETAAASQGNTIAANRLILDMTKRSLERNIKLAEITNAYKTGTRWDADGNPLPGKADPRTDRATSAGLNKALLDYVNNHPLYSDKEIYGDKKAGIPALMGIFEQDKNATAPVKRGRHGSMLEAAPPAA